MTLPRRIIVTRHAERVDDLFPKWIEKAGISGAYQAYDLNMPLTLPDINRPLSHYQGDTVITELGTVLAQMVGKGLMVNKSVPEVIYTSPSLRCVQTAHAVLQGMRSSRNIKILVEPLLFENTDVYLHGQPHFSSTNDLQMAGFNIDMSYKPSTDIEQIWQMKENANEYCDRVQKFIRTVAKGRQLPGMDSAVVMLVGHASTVDLAIGAFLQPMRKTYPNEFINNGLSYPYCATAIFDQKSPENWHYNETALPPISYTNFCSKINRHFAMRRHNAT